MKHRWLIISLLFAALVAIFDFCVLGILQTAQGDTLSYTVTAEYFHNHVMPIDPTLNHFVRARLLKPFYPAVISVFIPVVPPETSFLIINLLFFFGCVFFLYKILNEYLNFKPWQSFVGVAWFACSYPMLKYGFALMTDVGGYFFALLAIYIALMSDKRDRPSLLFWAGLTSAIGFTVKETGGLGMLFILFYWMMKIKELGFWNVFKRWLIAGIPFLTISLVMQLTIMNLSGYSYADWVGSNEEASGAKLRKLKYFAGTQGAAFHFLWLFFLYGLYKIKKSQNLKALAAFIPVGLPVLAWPIFITRILFFQFVYVIPVALNGLKELDEKLSNKKILTFALASLPCIVSIALFLFAQQRSLFKL
ncbi:MAG: glycosyltransferase family 39 protein [Patescibacteria group bacterium]|nr:glycosyltransferase family 39 protein [Patescibacteria group bacterium]